jgi:ketosteroid isomerase-like protein
MSIIRITVLAGLVLVSGTGLRGQSPPPSEEIPLERCDRLPVVKVQVGKSELRFLVDTAATTMLNLKSFSKGRVKEIAVTSWTGTAATSAREVFVPEMAIGKHRLRELKLPAIDLSPIGNACGGPIDGILGVDLMDRMGVTIDLKRQVASLAGDPPDAKAMYAEMDRSMGPCIAAFEQGRGPEFENCLDPEIVMYTPHGEFHGREQVLKYLQGRYFKFAPKLTYNVNMHEAQIFGDALWYSYDYSVETPEEHQTGHGMSMCRKTDGRWRILNLHNSVTDLAAKNAETSGEKRVP